MSIFCIDKYKSEILKLFLGERYSNLMRLLGIVLPNLLASLIEGLSYGCILLAFTYLSGGSPTINIPILHRLVENLPAQQAFFAFTIGAIIFQALRSTLTYVGQITATFLGLRIQIGVQRKVYEQILSFSFPFVNRYKMGDLMDHAQTPAQFICPLVDASNSLIVSSLAILVSFGLMFCISPQLTICAIVCFGMLVLVQRMLLRKMAGLSKSLAVHVIEYSKHLVQNIGGIRIVHTFHRQVHILNNVSRILEDIGRVTKKLSLLNNTFVPTNEVLGIAFVGLFLVIGAGIIGNEGSSLRFPILLTFIVIVYRLNSRIQNLVTGSAQFAFNWGKLTRLEELLSVDKKEFTSESGDEFTSFTDNISFNKVSFRYESNLNPALFDLSLSISKNSSVAFVGFSGAGKSSIMDLLVRLYEPSLGKILVDGRPLDTYSVESWRKQLAVVSQDTFIFNESIADNIRFGNLEASQAEIEHAARIANAHDFIVSLPQGYQTVVGERGFRLSGGEKQRVALARAVVRDVNIFILDEATSNLDTHSEKTIQNALDKLSSKTIIFVAHRLSTIVNCDKIFVMDKGKLIEAGTHDELLRAKGRYAELWEMQATKENMLAMSL